MGDGQSPSGRRDGTGEVRISDFSVHAEHQAPHETRSFRFKYQFASDGHGVSACFTILEIRNDDNQVVARCDGRLIGSYLKPPHGSASVVLRSPWLKPGRYHVRAIIDSGHGFFDDIECAAIFWVDGTWKSGGLVHPDAYCTASVISDFEFIENR